MKAVKTSSLIHPLDAFTGTTSDLSDPLFDSSDALDFLHVVTDVSEVKEGEEPRRFQVIATKALARTFAPYQGRNAAVSVVPVPWGLSPDMVSKDDVTEAIDALAADIAAEAKAAEDAAKDGKPAAKRGRPPKSEATA